MATITYIRELYEGRTGSEDDGSGKVLTRSFVVVTDNGECSPSVVMGAELNGVYIPKLGDNLRDSNGVETGCLCRSVSTTPRRSPRHWTVTCRYGDRFGGAAIPMSEGRGEEGASPNVTPGGDGLPPGFGGGPSGEGAANPVAVQIADPLLRPATVRYFAVKRMEAVYEDPDGQPLINSAGDPFDPPIQVEKVRLGIQITRFQARFDPSIIAEYVGAISSEKWAGFARQTAKCNDIAADRRFEGGVWATEVTYSFEIEHTGWNPRRFLNEGARYRLTALGTERLAFADDVLRPMAKGLLAANGTKLSAGASPTFEDIDLYPEVDFNALRLFR